MNSEKLLKTAIKQKVIFEITPIVVKLNIYHSLGFFILYNVSILDVLFYRQEEPIWSFFFPKNKLTHRKLFYSY